MLVSQPQTAISCGVTHQPLNGTKRQLVHQRLREAVQQRNYAAAIRLLNYLIAQEPNNASHYGNRGRVYQRCHQWAQAMVDYDQALLLNPKGDRIYSHRAKCHLAMGQWEEAIVDYDCAIDINPYNIRARIDQGVLFRELEMYDDAIVNFGLALFFGDLNAHIYAERGRTYHMDGHWNCAMGDYQRALDLLQKNSNRRLESEIRTWIAELIPNR